MFILKAAIITIGDEILIGQIVDTNSQWIAAELQKIGVSIYEIRSVQDDQTHILKALKEAENNADIVLITGGLGPTKDDITKHTLAKYFRDTLQINQPIVNHIQEMFSKKGISFSELNRQQGLLPTKCIPLQNDLGTAPGMWFEENKTIFISLPGVPYEMKGLMKAQVLPKIQNKFTLPCIIHKTILIYGVEESTLALLLEDWESQLSKDLSLAYLPSIGKLRLRISGKSFSENLLKKEIETAYIQLKNTISDITVEVDEGNTIEVVVAKLLVDRKKSLALAESCTGGAISQLLTSHAGASGFFKGGLVCYTEALKIKELGVSKKIISKYSVVSTAVAEAMALGIQKKMNADYAIATTGNAGPTTDLTDKPVGVVCIAIACPDKIISQEFNFGEPREKVIQRTSYKALELLRSEITKNYGK